MIPFEMPLLSLIYNHKCISNAIFFANLTLLPETHITFQNPDFDLDKIANSCLVICLKLKQYFNL